MPVARCVHKACGMSVLAAHAHETDSGLAMGARAARRLSPLLLLLLLLAVGALLVRPAVADTRLASDTLATIDLVADQHANFTLNVSEPGALGLLAQVCEGDLEVCAACLVQLSSFLVHAHPQLEVYSPAGMLIGKIAHAAVHNESADDHDEHGHEDALPEGILAVRAAAVAVAAAAAAAVGRRWAPSLADSRRLADFRASSRRSRRCQRVSPAT